MERSSFASRRCYQESWVDFIVAMDLSPVTEATRLKSDSATLPRLLTTINCWSIKFSSKCHDDD